MVVSRRTIRLRQTLVFYSLLQHHAAGQLICFLTEDLLPGSATGDQGILLREYLLPPLLNLLVTNEYIDSSLRQVDAKFIAIFENGEVTSRSSLGAGVENGGGP